MMDQANKIAREYMFENDAFSKWLGIEIVAIKPGYAHLEMTVRNEMLNGFKVAHGGISFSFADSAFAFASNNLGKKAVSLETSISHTKAVFENDVLTAKAKSLKEGKTISIFEVVVTNQNDAIIALFKGTVFKSGENWD